MNPLPIGVVSRSFPSLTHGETAQVLAAAGAVSTELCLVSADTAYWVYNGRSDLSTLTDAQFAGIVNAYREQGIDVPAFGVFTNLIDPKEDERKKNLDYFEQHMALASKQEIPFVATECGFTTHERGVNADHYEEDFDRLKQSLADLCQRAAHHGVCVALEPCVIDIVPSAKRMRDLIAQVGSDRLRVLLDPANLIANSSERDMFAYLAPYVAYFHGKDRKVNDVMGRAVGDGEIDWPLFLSLYHAHCEGKPFILEYVGPDNFREVMARVRTYDAQERA